MLESGSQKLNILGLSTTVENAPKPAAPSSPPKLFDVEWEVQAVVLKHGLYGLSKAKGSKDVKADVFMSCMYGTTITYT